MAPTAKLAPQGPGEVEVAPALGLLPVRGADLDAEGWLRLVLLEDLDHAAGTVCVGVPPYHLASETTCQRQATLVVSEQGAELGAQGLGRGPDREVLAEQLARPRVAVGDRQGSDRESVEDPAVHGPVGQRRARCVVENELRRAVDLGQALVGGRAPGMGRDRRDLVPPLAVD